MKIEQIDSMTLDQCNEELGAMCSESNFRCVEEAREALKQAIGQYARYHVTDGSHAEYDLRFAEAVGVIADWYEDMADWSELDIEDQDAIHDSLIEAILSVTAPEYGDVDTLREYARSVCAAIAAIGQQEYVSHSGYRVSAAECAGLVLRVDEAGVSRAYRFATDSESGEITARDFDEAIKMLSDMVPEEAMADGGWGWVEDVDGHRHRINC